ncbi:MAG: chorismate synthase [Oscillospiraceae bacterium]|nr:chorismate synthase [Oscillospiraceae bacterium]
MSSIFSGSALRLSIFGQSHSEAIGMTLDGLPAGIPLDLDRLQTFLNRRAPGQNDWSTPRREEDRPEFLSGLKNGKTCGAPLTAVIRNGNTRGKDYEQLRVLPRPGHADYTAQLKYGGYQDYSGGGHFSGRLTAPLCISGGILKQMLQARGILCDARILSIGPVQDDSAFPASVAGKDFPTVSDGKAEEMKNVIAAARADGDSVGGVIECVIRGVPGGLGEPMFDGVENRIAQLAFAVPAVKGIEFGSGFAAAAMRGSENNDAYTVCDGRVVTTTNHAGGILGGITDGMPVVFRVAVKPTPSIARAQNSINLESMEPGILRISGRHDPCIVPRAVPVIEAVAAIAISDLLLGGKNIWN